jgi:hypothetical protein
MLELDGPRDDLDNFPLYLEMKCLIKCVIITLNNVFFWHFDAADARVLLALPELLLKITTTWVTAQV